ncbi:tetratricopeptide repeat protein [Polynucleobacter hallstattensis]|uniref:tetratricopeptide repeat protein n=1 Tax=Polynucleobacter hallstattensis TaxID=1855586 RepID=UPI001C0B0A5D|nr:tetratricopeptide repeat protein [Polynucleobacter hallstattensis]
MLQQDSTLPLIEQAFNLHQQGKFKEAQAFYEQALTIDPNHFDVLQLLGTLFLEAGQFIKAVEFLTKALQIKPDFVEAYSNLGIALQELQRFEEALVSYNEAIRINPNYAEAYSNRGIALKELERFEEALVSYDQAISIKPDNAEAHSNRGVVLQTLQRFEEALVSYNEAIRINPNYVEAYCNRGIVLKELERFEEALVSYDTAIRIRPDYVDAYYNRGVALQDLKRFEEALISCDTAIAIKPHFAEAHSNRGIVLKELERFEEALVSFDQAIRIKPDYAEAYSNRGAALKELERFEEALVSYNKAITINPNYADAYSNRGNTLKLLKRFDEALASYHQAIAIKPDYANAHWNLSLCHLLLGNFKDGWQGYEWRWKNESAISLQSRRHFSQPLWLGGQSLVDKTILLHAEQGLGDTIQFCRYVSLVAQLGAKVILEVRRPLFKILQNLEGVSQLVAMGDPLPAFDYQCPLMSLPLAFNTEIESIPNQVPYIKAPPIQEEYWKTKLAAHQKLKVGLVWNGGFRPNQPELWSLNARRNIPLAQIAQINIPDINFYSLQKGEPAESELIQSGNQYWNPSNFYNFVSELDDFSDTAALIANLDLIISVDTSTAHLAAAMGKPIWLLNRFDTCWRWLVDRKDSPWYPTMTLYQQEEMGNWEGVIERVKGDLVGRV